MKYFLRLINLIYNTIIPIMIISKNWIFKNNTDWHNWIIYLLLTLSILGYWSVIEQLGENNE